MRLKTLCDNAEYISVTLDVWTNKRLRSYIGITMHTFVDSQLKSYLLSLTPLKDRHTAEALLSEFERVIDYYHIEKKLVRLITDNAANNIKAFDEILLPGFDVYFKNDNLNNDNNNLLQIKDDNSDDRDDDNTNDDIELTPLADDIIQSLSEN